MGSPLVIPRFPNKRIADSLNILSRALFRQLLLVQSSMVH